MAYMETAFKSGNAKTVNAMGSLTAIGTTSWFRVEHIPNGFFAQISGTSGTVTATCMFQFSNDGITLACKEGTTISLSGTATGAGVVADADGAKTQNPWVPWKYVRLSVSAISGTGAIVSASQVLGN